MYYKNYIKHCTLPRFYHPFLHMILHIHGEYRYILETCVDCACANLDQRAVIFAIAICLVIKSCKYTILHKRTFCAWPWSTRL